MFTIPAIFADENESYITLPAMKKFAKERRKEYLKTTVDRPSLITDIEEYANKSEDKQEIVLDWLDCVLKEGIKEVQIWAFDTDELKDSSTLSDSKVKDILEECIHNKDIRHYCNKFVPEIKLYRYDISEQTYGKVITLFLGELISVYDKKHGGQSYPYIIVVELYVDQGLIVGRSKSKSGMYKYMENFVLEAATNTYAETELKKGILHVTEMFSLNLKIKGVARNEFRRKLYKLLKRYTNTPYEILQLMEAKKEEIASVNQLILKNICALGYKYTEDVESDILNTIEKYFSISYPDKEIFIKDRDAYPLRIIATDEEDSKVEQTSGFEEPLQSKAIFFDNKKMLQKSQLCDGVYFRFQRRNPRYCSKEFTVKITTKKDYCILKFTEYTMEEDIIYVLFSLIGAE